MCYYGSYIWKGSFEKMKIAVLSFTSGQVSRGVETLVEELVLEWKKDNEVLLVNVMDVDWLGFGPGGMKRNLMIDRYQRVVFKETVKAMAKLKKFDPDVVMPVNGGWQSFLVRLYCWVFKKRMVIPGLAGLGWCDRWNLYVQPDVFIASTKRNAKWARQYNKRVKIEIIPHGVDLRRFNPEGVKMKVSLKRPIVLCVAGPDRYKRVEETIRAMVKVKNASLLLVGGSDEVERLGRKLLKSRFLRAKVKYDELDKFYRTADVFTMVSESSEEFGIVNLEALASGLPMVVTDDELRRELLGEFGIYVKDPSNANEYAKKLTQVCNKGQSFVTQRKNGGEKWLEKFSWKRISKEYLRVFRV